MKHAPRRRTNDSKRSPRRRRFGFRTATIAVTAAMHGTFALAMTGAAELCGLPHAGLVGIAVAATLFAVFFTRIRAMMPDRPRPWWTVRLFDEPYFAHWCAALCSFVPIAIAAAAKPLVLFLSGRAPALPSTFALAVYLASLVLASWGVFVRRRWVQVNRVDIAIPGLPPEFEGYRVVQLSDLHIGSLTPRHWGEAWARTSNEAKPDLVVVTGDLVTSGVDFHADIAGVVGMLRAIDGVFVCMGNHDYFGDGEPLVGLLRDAGATVLRNEGTTLTRRGAILFLAGVDDTWTKRANVERALAGRKPGVVTVLLAHDPNLFPHAAEVGAELVLSGHTHGGQVAFPFLSKSLNLGRLASRFYLGLYYEGGSTLYVHAGLGTTGPPIRLGVAPEIAILTLRAA